MLSITYWPNFFKAYGAEEEVKMLYTDRDAFLISLDISIAVKTSQNIVDHPQKTDLHRNIMQWTKNKTYCNTNQTQYPVQYIIINISSIKLIDRMKYVFVFLEFLHTACNMLKLTFYNKKNGNHITKYWKSSPFVCKYYR